MKYQDMILQMWRLTLSSIDVTIKALSRLAYQFQDSDKFKAFLTAFLDEFQYLQDQNENLKTLRYLNTAQGVQLDGIGEILGLTRPTRPVDVAGLFGFVDDDTAKGFGILSNPDIGGNFWDGTQAVVLIGDDLYRLLLRAKAIENQTAMIVDDTTRLISFMFGDIEVRYFLTTNLSPRYDIGKFLDDFEVSLLADLPILIGISDVTYFAMYDAESFGFSDDPDAFGFSDITDTSLGGPFAKIIT